MNSTSLAVPGENQSDSLGPVISNECDRRATQRFTLLIRTAKVIAADGEFFCIVREVSAEGIRIKLFHPLPNGDRFEVELANGERHTIFKVWENDGHAGFRFACPVNIDRLVAATPPDLRKREISLSCVLPGILSSRSGECDVQVFEISQFGARIECRLHLAVGERIRLDTEKLPPLIATVRSRRARIYGLLFERPFALNVLARMCGVVGPIQLPDQPPCHAVAAGH